MKCAVDHNYWCERHRTHHRGRLYELSQMENEMGERYRLSWDKVLAMKSVRTALPAAPKKPCNCRQAKR